MSKPLLTLLMAGTVLAGCTMAPSYERPAASVAQAWPADTVAELPAETQASIQSIGWKDFFSSPVCNRPLIRRSLITAICA